MFLKSNPWDNDLAFEDYIIDEVHGSRADGWEIYFNSRTICGVPSYSPVVPLKGMTVRFYGSGFGRPVRGIFLDGQPVYYRTVKEQEIHHKKSVYGKHPQDVIDRWDAGRSIFSVAVGGFGPGYEQVCQIVMIEFLRFYVAADLEIDENTTEREDVDPRLGWVTATLGPSGSQWSAGRALARSIYQFGPVEAITAYNETRHIQVSKNFPHLPPAPNFKPVVEEAS